LNLGAVGKFALGHADDVLGSFFGKDDAGKRARQRLQRERAAYEARLAAERAESRKALLYVGGALASIIALAVMVRQ
jgi:uncharacterized protein YdaU (DUF1376 family)